MEKKDKENILNVFKNLSQKYGYYYELLRLEIDEDEIIISVHDIGENKIIDIVKLY